MTKKIYKRSEKIFSLLEIFILVTSVITFAYFIGEEFGFVSAESAAPSSAAAPAAIISGTPAAERGAELAAEAAVPPSAVVPSTAGSGIPSLAEGGYGGATASNGLASTEGLMSSSSTATSAAGIAPTTTPITWAQVGSYALQIVGNAAIAAVLYFGTYYILTGIFKVNGAAAASLAEALASGYFYGAGAGMLISALGGSSLTIPITIPMLGPLAISGWGLIGVAIGLIIWIFAGVHDQKV
jgi:hypothetical protein